jgi:hypothetical protein
VFKITGVVPGGGTVFKGLPARARCKVPSPSGRCVDSAEHDGTTRDLTMSSTDVVEIKSRAELAREAVDFRSQGHGYDEIGDQMGVSAQDAAALVAEGVQSIAIDIPANARALDIRRTEQLMSSIYATAAAGDIDAIKVVLRLMRHRSALDGSHRLPPPQRARTRDLFKLEARGDLFAIE